MANCLLRRSNSIGWKVINTTDISKFKKNVPDNYKLENIQKLKWRMTDTTCNSVEWILIFNNNFNEYTLHSNDKYQSFTVWFLMNGNNIEILKAIYNGRNEESINYLKKYSRICMLANCFLQMNLLKT